MTTTEALALTAKPIPDDLAKHFFTEVRQRLNDGEIIGREMLCRWCETHKDRLMALNAEFYPVSEDHNPDGLDADTIGIADGWRLLNKSVSRIERQESQLEAIRKALETYHAALRERRHGAIAATNFAEAVETILNQPYRP